MLGSTFKIIKCHLGFTTDTILDELERVGLSRKMKMLKRRHAFETSTEKSGKIPKDKVSEFIIYG